MDENYEKKITDLLKNSDPAIQKYLYDLIQDILSLHSQGII